MPTGRNLHGFDRRTLDEAALRQGQAQAERLLATHREASQGLPESIAIVLWGSDNLKSGGAPIGQALALLGCRPRLDSYGRLCGAALIPLETLGRPRIDVLITLSGIFRDLLPLQTRLLAEAAWLAASADEPPELNYVRRNTLAYQAEHGVDLETAALRVFSNKEGAYGANVNLLVDAGTWQGEDELGDATPSESVSPIGPTAPRSSSRACSRACWAESTLPTRTSTPSSSESPRSTTTSTPSAASAAPRAWLEAARRCRSTSATKPKGGAPSAPSRSRLDSKAAPARSTRNGLRRCSSTEPRAFAKFEAQVTNTFGWSATTSQVQPWVYRELTKTYVLDEVMRARLSKLNPKASLKLAQRLIEASERSYWKPDEETMAALYAAGDELEDTLEGVPNERVTLGAA